MTEENYSHYDNIIMDELNVKSIARPFGSGDGKTIELRIEKGSSKYYFMFGGCKCKDSTNERFRESGLLMELLGISYGGKK